MDEDKIKQALRNRLTNKRYQHVLAVTETAEGVARDSLGDLEPSFIAKIRQAALLHDYAKDLAKAKIKQLADQIAADWGIDENELAIPQVLHAPVSAYLAFDELGIYDPQVLEAIRYHTIGSPDMGVIAQIVFIADFIEPAHTFSSAEEVRQQLSLNGIRAAIILICDFNLRYNIEQRRQLHPNTVLLRNAYLRRQT